MAAPPASRSSRSPFTLIGDALISALSGVLSIAEVVLTPLQNLIGAQRMAYFFLLPNMLIFSIFILLPMLLNFYYGFTSGTSILPENRPFVGTANFQDLLYCEDYSDYLTCEEDFFWRAARNTAVYVVAEVSTIVLLSLITALALNRQIRGRAFFRSVFFYPVLLSPVVVAIIWKWLLQQDNGLLNAIVIALGGEKTPWLLQANSATVWVIIVSVWAHMGFYTLILLAGLQSIPGELYEAGSMDGANGWSSFRFITLPLLMPTMLVVLVLSLIRAVQVFDQVYVLTGGGPGTATMYIVQYIYRAAFQNQQFGMAAAASLVLALVLFTLTLVQLRAGRSGETGA